MATVRSVYLNENRELFVSKLLELGFKCPKITYRDPNYELYMNNYKVGPYKNLHLIITLYKDNPRCEFMCSIKKPYSLPTYSDKRYMINPTFNSMKWEIKRVTGINIINDIKKMISQE